MNEKQMVQQAYETFKEDCGCNTMQVMSFLEFLRDEGVLHHLVDMKHLTTLEITFIDDLLHETK